MIRYLAVIPLVLIPGLLLGGFAQANDQLGIYWDAEFTQDSISTDTFPSIHTGYLVLMDPTSVLGVSKWECCVGIEGPAIFISWVLAEQALNLETPPCFWVSISSDPLPAGGPVLLATFMTMVTVLRPSPGVRYRTPTRRPEACSVVSIWTRPLPSLTNSRHLGSVVTTTRGTAVVFTT